MMSTPHGAFTSCMSTSVDVKLNGENYIEWSATVRIIFRALELIDHIEGTSSSQMISASGYSSNTPSATTAILASWRAADHRAMVLIALSVEVPIRMKIVDLPTAQEMWNHIRHLYDKKQFLRVQNSNSFMSQSMMHPRVIRAARSGNIAQLQELYAEEPNLINSSSTPYGNTALHLAVIFRQEELAKELCSKCPSLLSAANTDGNTPLMLAAAAGLYPIVTFVISPASPLGDVEEGKQWLMATNKTGNNALHEALKNGHGKVALKLLRAEPELAWQVNNNKESPLYMACRRSMKRVVKELLKSSAASQGPNGETALHAAVKALDSGLVDVLRKERPGLVKVKDSKGRTPLHYASRFNELELVKLLLDSDASLAYAVDEADDSPITWAVKEFRYPYVPIFEEFIRCCPDSALVASKDGNTVLHVAVDNGSVDIVKYIVRTPELQGLINQPNNAGDVPFDVAVRRGNRKTILALLACKSLDQAAVNNWGIFLPELAPRLAVAFEKLRTKVNNSFADVYISHLVSNQGSLQGIYIETFRTYFNNSLVVATLMASVTFAAAFNVPGGYDGNPGADQGLPILARKAAFKAFLISDTIAMCASLAVAFGCVFAPWVDDKLLEGYMDNTSKLLVLGFEAMSVAFATRLYVVVAPGSLWLAVLICVLCCSLILFTYLSTGPFRYLILPKVVRILNKIFPKIFRGF